ncbi:MAG TPA: Zn-ribbon containing protein [Methanocella sp.]|uniref:OapC/ArvC family zinc-ribbon domain-containing protein n=1 Tax=Methanocella sp. TaxID=2052833 RepID=UPI002D0D9EF1|nr:Zn-ribbon containing protein [Methanocella sp.]HTY90409.1 Zn-ribbon containing protein [Methanocella sp.]
MPHRCLECKNVLQSGELNLNTGCPVCGGKKFEYVRPQKKEPAADPLKMTVSEYVAYADSIEPKPAGKPKPAQAKHKEAPKHRALKPAEPKAGEKKPEHRIESVRIVEKGSYDLNLPMLLNRKGLVMSKEDGVYVVDLPSALKADPKKKRR